MSLRTAPKEYKRSIELISDFFEREYGYDAYKYENIISHIDLAYTEYEEQGIIVETHINLVEMELTKKVFYPNDKEPIVTIDKFDDIEDMEEFLSYMTFEDLTYI